MNTVAEMNRRAALDDFRRPYAVFESCSGKFVDKDDKYWVVDIDKCSLHEENQITPKWKFIAQDINRCLPEGDKIELVLPTRSGVHLVTKPFNSRQFVSYYTSKGFEIPDIKRNPLTLLYEAL